MAVINICLTGGPCSGKTSTIERLKEVDEIKGYKLLLVPEAATLLLAHGFSPEPDIYTFERAIFKLQIALSKIYNEYVEGEDNVLIIHDRGIQDTLSFLDKEYQTMLCCTTRTHNFKEYYDCIVHLVSVAYDKPEVYSNIDNELRFHSLEEAKNNEEITLEFTKRFDNYHIIYNNGDFDDKYNEVLRIIEKEIESREE